MHSEHQAFFITLLNLMSHYIHHCKHVYQYVDAHCTYIFRFGRRNCPLYIRCGTAWISFVWFLFSNAICFLWSRPVF